MDEKRVADYFVVVGLPDNPKPLEEYSNEGILKPDQSPEPIVELCVIIKSLGETCPENFRCVEFTPTGFPADLNHGSIRAHEVYICYRRGRDLPPITDIGVLYEGKERVKAGCEVIHTTPDGRPANVNNSNSSRTYITFRRAEESAPPDTLVVMDINVILTNKGESPPHAFKQIGKNLNKGLTFQMGSDVFLCYKKSMAKKHVLVYKAGILGRYPKEDYPGLPLPLDVPMFCLPLGASLESWPEGTSMPRTVFSTFVLTSTSPEDAADKTNLVKVYGAAIMFYEEYNQDKLSDLQKQNLGLLDKKGSKESDEEEEVKPHRKIVHQNKCICLLSRWPFFNTYRRFLKYLHQMTSTGPHPVPIERHISHFLSEVPFPSPQVPRILVQFTYDMIPLSQPADTPLAQSGASFTKLLNNLGPENCLNLLLYALLEHKILIHSLRPDVLTSVAEALLCVIFPFHWECPYIPLCPLTLSDVLNAPIPFIVGVDSRYFDMYDPPVEVTCVDLDTNNITPTEDRKQVTYKMFPKKAVKVLKSTLEKLFEQLCQSSDTATPEHSNMDLTGIDQDFNKKRKELITDTLIQEAFLRFMATILKGYDNFLLPITRAPTSSTTDVSSLFDVHGFLKSRDKTYHKFFTQLMRTQLFSRFIEVRSFASEKDDSLAFFDECMQKVDDYYYDSNTKLIDLEENHRSETTKFVPPPETKGLPDNASYSYTCFPELDNALFLPKSTSAFTMPLKPAVCPSTPMTRRTKQEIKSSQKTAKKISESPSGWAKCLLGHCFSLWFIHLPSYMSTVHSKSKALRIGYDVLVKMQNSRLQPPDEVCYRVLMQLCGMHNQPVLAVKVLFQLQSIGVQPNAITYGYYNKVLLESKWPSSDTTAYQRWMKIRNMIMAIAQFRQPLHRRAFYATSESDCISRASTDSFMDETSTVDGSGRDNSRPAISSKTSQELVSDLVPVLVESPSNEESTSTGGMSDRGYSSMTGDDAKRNSTLIGSQDSLDSLPKAAHAALRATDHDQRKLVMKSNVIANTKLTTPGVKPQRQAEKQVAQQLDFSHAVPKEKDTQKRRSGGIVRKSGGPESFMKTTSFSSQAGLLMISTASFDQDIISAIGLSYKLNSGKPPGAPQRLKNPRHHKRSLSFHDQADMKSKTSDWILKGPTMSDQQSNASDSSTQTVKTTGNFAQVINSTDVDNVTNSSEVSGDNKTKNPEIKEELQDLSNQLEQLDGESNTDNIGNVTNPAIAGTALTLTPTHSARTPVTENDPLGLFTPGSLHGSSTTNSSGIETLLSLSPAEGNETKDSGVGDDGKNSDPSLLIDMGGFSTTSTPTHSNSLVNRPALQRAQLRSLASDVSSPGSPAKTPSSMSQSQAHNSDMSGKRASTLPSGLSGLPQSSPHRRAVGRSESFSSAFKTAASYTTKMFSSRLSAFKQSIASQPLPSGTEPGDQSAGLPTGHPKPHDMDKLLMEEEDVHSRRRGDSLDSARLAYCDQTSTASSEDLTKNKYLQKYNQFANYLDGLWQHSTNFTMFSQGLTHSLESLKGSTSSKLEGKDMDHLSVKPNLKGIGGSTQSLQPVNTAMEVEMCSLSKCPACCSLLYDEDIMAGWSADDSNLNTSCQVCNQKLVPSIHIQIKDYRQSCGPLAVTPSLSSESMQSIQSMPNCQTTKINPAHRSTTSLASIEEHAKQNAPCHESKTIESNEPCSSPPEVSPEINKNPELTESLGNEIEKNGESLENTNPEHCSSSGVTNLQESKVNGVSSSSEMKTSTSVGAASTESSCQEDEGLHFTAPPSEQSGNGSNHQVTAVNGIGPERCKKASIDSTESLESKPDISSRKKSAMLADPFTVPYLSPLVLRKEMENVVEQEGDMCLDSSDFVDKHNILFWNLIWYFKRLEIPSHLPGHILTAKSTNVGLPTPPKCWASGDSRHVQLRLVWDNLSMQTDKGLPMYVLWAKSTHGQAVHGLVNQNQIRLMKDIKECILENEVLIPLQRLMEERQRLKKTGLSRFRSMYRDILFLTFTMLGQDNIDIDAFDREYRAAYNEICREMHAYRYDAPPSRTVRECRSHFANLELVIPHHN